MKMNLGGYNFIARLAQSVERKALNLVVVGSSPTVGVYSVDVARVRGPVWKWKLIVLAASIWTHWDLNPGPSACEADVIPLHHVPCCLQRFYLGPPSFCTMGTSEILQKLRGRELNPGLPRDRRKY